MCLCNGTLFIEIDRILTTKKCRIDLGSSLVSHKFGRCQLTEWQTEHAINFFLVIQITNLKWGDQQQKFVVQIAIFCC